VLVHSEAKLVMTIVSEKRLARGNWPPEQFRVLHRPALKLVWESDSG
jgi:hypothetical protein